MSKPGKARYRLSAVKASYSEALGGELVEVETDDGKVYTFPHPLFMGDADAEKLNAEDGDTAKARILLGDQWDDYVKSGGDANGLMLVFMAVRAETQDTMGKHRPPRK
ncbi:hypothetical protein [Streptomyces chryseus]|uniref:hypothetical protein n=1 Tax=Streptomyces chryseus TaxID=68186 RepID=UPI00110FEDFE|nr:hypothetical protein [Streptomyces chryseus]GGX01899.1 hypothetical protein GCM10010353_16890 [Streptomyces chryseus]